MYTTVGKRTRESKKGETCAQNMRSRDSIVRASANVAVYFVHS